MGERLVERVEVVPDRLDLATVDDLVAEPEEDVLDLAGDLRQRMQVAAPHGRSGESDVECLVELLQLPEGDAPGGLALGLLEPHAQGIERPSCLAIPNFPQSLRQRRTAAEI